MAPSVALVELGTPSRERVRPVPHSIQRRLMSASPVRDFLAVSPVPSTVLKWGWDGELSERDRFCIVHRLRLADPFASQLPLVITDAAVSTRLTAS
ncbi:MAG: hypothetical protein ACKOCM_05185 [Cyanobacteriota bacterium]